MKRSTFRLRHGRAAVRHARDCEERALQSSRVTHDYRIGEGGLLRRFEVAAHLKRLPARLVWLVAVIWLPLVVLGVWTGSPDALVCQRAVHVRLLVAAPVFLILDQLFPAICRYTLGQLHQQSFVSAQAQQRVDGLLRSAARLADSLLHQRALW